jgi:diguanylate cyclase (GGDEF)-like protein
VSTPAASLAFALAFALALGFHRYRAAQICALLALLALGVDAGSLLLREAALRLLPWLVLACALIPEPRLLSRRHAALVLFTGSLLLVALYAPPRLLAMPLQMAAWPLPGLDPGRGARLLLMLAAAVCALRFLRQRQPMEAGLVAGLLLAAIGAGRPTELSTWLLASALTATVAVLYSSYRMAFVDPLSALPNRRALDETLGRLSGSYSLAMIDIDHFKAFNDQHGHAAGDIVLRRVAQRLRQTAGGKVFRYGGEEFCVVYAGLDAELAGQRLEAARVAVQDQILELPAAAKPTGKAASKGTTKPRPKARPSRTQQVEVTISAGVAARSERRKQAGDVLKAADQALYQAKAKGRNRVERSR